MAFMDIDIKTLHLCREIHYCDSGLAPSADPAVLVSHARAAGECLLLFDDTAFTIQTEDGPRLNGVPSARTVFAVESAASAELPGGAGETRGTLRFVLEKGDYAFFQTRYPAKGAKPEWMHSLFEEFVRQLWWEQIECRGPWMLRIVPEDNEIAFQTLRRLA